MFSLTFCCSASGHLQNIYPVSVAYKSTEISHGKIGQITIYDHVQRRIVKCIHVKVKKIMDEQFDRNSY